MCPAVCEASTTSGTPASSAAAAMASSGSSDAGDVRGVRRDREAPAAARGAQPPTRRGRSRRCSRRHGRPRGCSGRSARGGAAAASPSCARARWSRSRPPSAASPRIARLSASVAFLVKISSSGVSAPSRSASRSRARLTAPRRGDRAPVTGAAGVAAGVREEVLDRLENGRRLRPRGGGVVEVDRRRSYRPRSDRRRDPARVDDRRRGRSRRGTTRRRCGPGPRGRAAAAGRRRRASRRSRARARRRGSRHRPSSPEGVVPAAISPRPSVAAGDRSAGRRTRPTRRRAARPRP